MKKQNQLLLARSIFVFFIIIVFGFIIISEKGGELFIPKAKQKMNSYLEEKYIKEKDNWLVEETTYKNKTYKEKIVSKENKNLYFFIIYKNKKVTDTYKKDYIEGKTLINYLNKKLKKQIFEKTNIKNTVSIPLKLNEYTSKVQEQIIKENNLLELKIYQIEIELQIKEWNEVSITKDIIKVLNSFKNNKINPKSISIVITNQNDITESIKISNITQDFSTNNNNTEIISAIIKKNNASILKNNNIEVEYLN